MDISRRDFLKGLGLTAGVAALGIVPELPEPESPEFVEYDIDNDVLNEAITISETHIEDGEAWVTLELDTTNAWRAVIIYANDGSAWRSADGGETWQLEE